MKKYIQIISDLHLEWQKKHFYNLPETETDKNTLLILLGDIGMLKYPNTYIPFLINCSKQFEQVLYIPGNHEYYGSDIKTAIQFGKNEILKTDLFNVFFGDNFIHKYNGIKFICSTLWTNMDNNNPFVILKAHQHSDFSKIKFDNRNLNPQDYIDLHEKAIKFIIDSISITEKTILITHYGVSFKSIHDAYIKDDLNALFVSELESLIKIGNFWKVFHGHNHYSINYKINDTQVICNPYGYAHLTPNPNFDPLLKFEL